jgi:hypothetical protein
VAESGLTNRNKIINGDMRIDQRNAGAAIANANAYIARGVDPFTHAANLRTVARIYRRKHAALVGGGS